jgi:hypothetical protein
MSDLKYNKYVLTELKLPAHKQERETDYNRWAKHLLWLDDSVIEGASFVNTAWYFKPESNVILAHTHDFDEVVGFFGTDPKNPYDLGGEIEFWLEDEKYLIQNSCLIYIPKGLQHCPEHVLRVDRPIFHVSLAGVTNYQRTDSKQ